MKALKHMVRTISANPNSAVGSDSPAEVEKELAVYFEGGWTLFDTHSLGMGGGNVTILYILTKDEDVKPKKTRSKEPVLGEV